MKHCSDECSELLRARGVNRVAKALNRWQRERSYARTGALRSCKRLFALHFAVMSVRLGWQTGCTITND